MSYRITYETDKGYTYVSYRRKTMLPLMTLFFFALFLLIVKAFWERGSDIVFDRMEDDFISVLDRAIKYVFCEIKSGTSFPELIETFCRETWNEVRFIR